MQQLVEALSHQMKRNRRLFHGRIHNAVLCTGKGKSLIFMCVGGVITPRGGDLAFVPMVLLAKDSTQCFLKGVLCRLFTE
jgi:hypothetical protein